MIIQEIEIGEFGGYSFFAMNRQCLAKHFWLTRQTDIVKSLAHVLLATALFSSGSLLV